MGWGWLHGVHRTEVEPEACQEQEPLHHHSPWTCRVPKNCSLRDRTHLKLKFMDHWSNRPLGRPRSNRKDDPRDVWVPILARGKHSSLQRNILISVLYFFCRLFLTKDVDHSQRYPGRWRQVWDRGWVNRNSEQQRMGPWRIGDTTLSKTTMSAYSTQDDTVQAGEMEKRSRARSYCS